MKVGDKDDLFKRQTNQVLQRVAGEAVQKKEGDIVQRSTDEIQKKADETIQRKASHRRLVQLGLRPAVQTALKVNKPGDSHELEADATADKVMRMTDVDVQRSVAPEASRKEDSALAAGTIQKQDAKTLQRKESGVPEVNSATQAAIMHPTGGQKMPPAVQGFMEKRFQVDFSQVKIHNDDQAAGLSNRLGAKAFTYKNNIYFNRGAYQPESDSGKHLLAHELTHVVQQGHAVQRKPETAISSAPAKVQRLGISDALDYFADKAYLIPGFRMFAIILGVNPINMQKEARTAANILRAVVEFLPGGNLITRVLDKYAIFEKAGAWVEGQLNTLGISGSSIRAAIDRFLDSLSWRDIFDLGGVWDRAKRIFTDPIGRIITFVKNLFSAILDMIRQAVLLPLAKLAQGTRGYDLLRAVLGKDPITGEVVPQTADNLIGGFMKLIGQQEVWENIKKGKAVQKAWTWFKTVLKGVLAFVTSIPTLIINSLKALVLEDFFNLSALYNKLVLPVFKFVASFVSWGFDQVIKLLKILFSVVAPKVLPYISKAQSAFTTILKNPVRFVGNLVRAGKKGFQLFATNILTHLKTALIKWLVGPLGEAGVYIPKSFGLLEIVKLVLSVLGLTWQNIRKKLVKYIPEPVLKGLEKTFDILITLVREGPAAAWEKIKAELSELKQMLIQQVTQFISVEVVKAAIAKLVTSLNPAGAVIQAILAIYKTISFFIEKINQIAAVVASFIDSIAAIAAGNVTKAAQKVETTMANTLTVIIAFLAKLVGLGGVPKKIVSIIKKIRQPIDKGIDKVVGWLVGLLKKAVGFVKDKSEKLIQWWKLRKSFTDKGGIKHSIYFQGKGADAELMVASTPKYAHTLLNEILKSDDGKKVSSQIKNKIEKVRKLKLKITSLSLNAKGKNKTIIKEINTLIVEIGKLFSEVSIDGKNQKMKEVTLTFDKIYDGMEKEYARQLSEQQSTIRKMTISKWLTNRYIFEKKGRISDSTLRHQVNKRNLTKEQYVAEQTKKGLKPKEIDKLWDYSAAATHSLDQAAGGDHYEFSNVGVHSVNSHIGS
ncbi:MAG: DUF4157 domain-containing protein, partial [Saprospiraceae bacterium]|nr:DUF4157 domain-containing protein [Saprospiraceae bacterium]